MDNTDILFDQMLSFQKSLGLLKTCYWCAQDKKNAPAFKTLRAPIDVDMDEEGKAYPVYSTIGMCEKHLNDYENREGVYDSYQ